MSELRTYDVFDVIMTPSDDCSWVLKSEADKVIAEKDKEIAKLKEQVSLLQAEFTKEPGEQ